MLILRCCLSIAGWFTLQPALDTSTATYQEFLRLYNDKKLDTSPDATYHSAAVFNGILAVAKAASSLFDQRIYASNGAFGQYLRNQMGDFNLERNLTGAACTVSDCV